VGQDPTAVPTTDNPSGAPAVGDDAVLAAAGAALADAVAAALPAWVERALRTRAPDVGDEVVAAVTAEVEAEVLGDLRALLARDVDEQRQSPLSVVRRAAATVGGALDALGAAPPARDDHQRSLFPDDHHDLVPASFADLSEGAGQAGITWGAAKAFVHRRRHRG
jgi:hypothetical protein